MIKISKWKVPPTGGQNLKMESPPYRGSIARRQPFDGLTALGLASVHCSALPRAHAHSFEIRQHAPAQFLSLMSLTKLESGVAPMARPGCSAAGRSGGPTAEPRARSRRA
jgi:hypothetical protein